MIDVEHSTLSTFSQNALAGLESLVELYLCVGERERLHILNAFHPQTLFLAYIVIGIVQVLKYLLVTALQRSIFLREVFKDITYTQRRAGCLLGISGTYTLTCSADLVLTLSGLISTIQHTMSGQNQMGALGNMETALEVVSCSLKFLSLSHKQVGSNHTAVADDIELTLIEYTAGDAAEHELLTFEYNGVSGIRTACKTGYDIILGGETVDDLTFTFVTKNNAQEGIHFSF